MSLSVWELFLALFKRGNGDEELSGEDDEGRFVPSPLDLSIRIAHGGSDDQRVREISKINQRAQELREEQQRSN